MDVHCSTCNQPWDVHHLWHYAIFDTYIGSAEAHARCELPKSHKLSKRYRDQFKAAGWEFGGSVINVIRCLACPKAAKPNAERVATKAALEELLGDDEDGLAAAFEDYNL